MTLIDSARVCKTVGDLKKAIVDIPDHIKLVGMGEDVAGVEIWEMNQDDDEMSYMEETERAEMENRDPDYRAVTIEFEDEEFFNEDDDLEDEDTEIDFDMDEDYDDERLDDEFDFEDSLGDDDDD